MGRVLTGVGGGVSSLVLGDGDGVGSLVIGNVDVVFGLVTGAGGGESSQLDDACASPAGMSGATGSGPSSRLSHSHGTRKKRRRRRRRRTLESRMK